MGGLRTENRVGHILLVIISLHDNFKVSNRAIVSSVIPDNTLGTVTVSMWDCFGAKFVMFLTL